MGMSLGNHLPALVQREQLCEINFFVSSGDVTDTLPDSSERRPHPFS
jgi:hypothetical protein